MLAAAKVTSGARALDIGCGPGRAAVVLASKGLKVTAVDLHEPLLEEARRRAVEAGVGDRVAVEVADMRQLPFSDRSFELVWAEGSAYVMGVREALRAWHRLLVPGGRVALTECVWTADRPSPAAREFWEAAYPTMRTAEGVLKVAADAGYDVLDWWVLPESDWWEEYYRPLARRLDELPAAERRGAAETAHEIDLRRSHGDEYGYAAYVLASTTSSGRRR